MKYKHDYGLSSSHELYDPMLVKTNPCKGCNVAITQAMLYDEVDCFKTCRKYKTYRVVLLHLGCGNIRIPGYVNIDIRETGAVDLVMDIANLNYPDNSIGMIYACSCLEHFSYRLVSDVLREWHRVMKPAGELVLVVPDFDKLVKIYLHHFTWNIFKTRLHARVLNDAFQGDFMGGQDYPENTHKTLFNYQYLKSLLLDVGFYDVKRVRNGYITTKDSSRHYGVMTVSCFKGDRCLTQ